jgi:hypothetical protein
VNRMTSTLLVTVWALAAVAALVGPATPARPLLVITFLLVWPGMALVRMLDLVDWHTELTLAVAASLVLDTLVAEAMLWGHVWSPDAAFAVLLGITAVAWVVGLRRPVLESKS